MLLALINNMYICNSIVRIYFPSCNMLFVIKGEFLLRRWLYLAKTAYFSVTTANITDTSTHNNTNNTHSTKQQYYYTNYTNTNNHINHTTTTKLH